MIIFEPGIVFHLEDSDRFERLIWRAEAGHGWFCIDIHAPAAVPFFRTLTEFDELLDSGLIQTAEDPWGQPVPEAALTAAQRGRRDEGWALIQPLVLAQPRCFESRHRARLCTEIEQTNAQGATRQKVARLIRRYWQRGMTPNALLPDYANSGAPGRSRASGAAKRGRPAVIGLPGMNIDARVRQQIKDTVTRVFARNHKLDVSEAYQRLLETYFMDTTVDPVTGRQSQHLRHPTPSLGQFRYWLEKDNDTFALERRRRTPRVYDKDMRGVLGTSESEVTGPGSRWQIDATIADVYLVSRMDRRRIVGRPTLYFVIDVFSRMIVGLHVGLEAPSWVGAMSALVNAASDKVGFCRAFGITIEPEDWPSQGLPDVLLGDRGEMLGERAEVLVKHFGVRLENTPPYRADLKGIVEKRFDLIQAAFGPYVPGYVEPDFRQRGARDYRLDAAMTIDEFTAVIISCVLAHNIRRLRDYPRDAQMIAEDVPPIPVELWDWGIARRSGALRRYPEETVHLSLLPEADATVTATGLRFYGCFYSCAEAIAAHWFDKARQRGSWKRRISYDPRSLDTIWLQGEGARPAFTACGLTSRSEMWRGRTLWEIDQIRQSERRATARHEPAGHEAKAARNRRIGQIVADAAEQTKASADPVASRAERVRDIRRNRAEEREALHRERAISTPAPPGDGDAIEPAGRPPRGRVIPFKPDAADPYDEPSIADFEADLLAQLGDPDHDA